MVAFITSATPSSFPFPLRMRGLILKKFFDDDDSDSDGGANDGCVRERVPQERRDREVKDSPNESETINFGPSYSSVRTQKKTTLKPAAVAAAAVAASITSRLLSCEAHSVAAPSVKPVQLQVCAFSVLVNVLLQLFPSGLVTEALCLSRQCSRCVPSFSYCLPPI